MKMKIFLLALFCIVSISSTKAQKTNQSKEQIVDSLEMNSYRQLLSYISADTQVLKLAETEKNTISHTGEKNFLYVPIARGAASEQNDYVSWDKWLPSVYHRDATVGSPFLLFAYVPGQVVNNSYSIINKPGYLYNYDKVTGNLLLKRDNEPPIAVYKELVKQFCLKNDKGGFIFVRVPMISNDEFFQVIYKGPKYSSYKLYKVNFVIANQASNGYTKEGNDYDEYVDVPTYYLVDEKKETVYTYELKKKSVKYTFGAFSQAIENYFKEHKYDEVTEQVVAGLTEILNR